MVYLLGILGLAGYSAAVFIAGWIVGPRIITPLVQKLIAKASGVVPPAAPSK